MTEYVDSFGIYALLVGSDAATSQTSLMTRWNSIGFGNLNMAVVAGAGARGNPALFLPFGASICQTFSHQTKYILGIRVNMSSVSGVGGNTNTLLELWNCDVVLCSLRVNGDGSILVFGNDNTGTVIATAPPSITANVDAYLELSATISGSSNMNVAAQIWVNGISVGSGNANIGRNANTLKSLTANFNRVFLYSGVSNPGGAYISDLYLNNGSGSTNTGAYNNPSIAIDAYPLPNGDSTPLQWSPLGGVGTHFSQINELPADGNASYVSSSTPGQIDCYTWQDILSFSGTIGSVQLSYCARTNDEGIRSFAGNIGATEQTTSTFGLPFSYQYFHQAFDVDPITGIAWTQPNFNAKKFGVTLVS